MDNKIVTKLLNELQRRKRGNITLTVIAIIQLALLIASIVYVCIAYDFYKAVVVVIVLMATVLCWHIRCDNVYEMHRCEKNIEFFRNKD